MRKMHAIKGEIARISGKHLIHEWMYI